MIFFKDPNGNDIYMNDVDIVYFLEQRLDIGNSLTKYHYWSGYENQFVLADGPLVYEGTAPICFGKTIREVVANAVFKFMSNGCTFEQAIGREPITQ